MMGKIVRSYIYTYNHVMYKYRVNILIICVLNLHELRFKDSLSFNKDTNILHKEPSANKSI